MKQGFKLISFLSATIIFILICLYAMIGFETYCWWNPSIDTVYAEKFTENGFDKISVGMKKTDVIKLIGDPLDETYDQKNEKIIWHYTEDGKASFGDWAWLGRQVHFNKEMIVTNKYKTIYYD